MILLCLLIAHDMHLTTVGSKRLLMVYKLVVLLDILDIAVCCTLTLILYKIVKCQIY